MQNGRNERIRAKMVKPTGARTQPGAAASADTGSGERKRLSLKFGG